MHRDISRRAFAAMMPAAATLVATRSVAAPALTGPTAADVIGRIHAKLGAEGITVLPDDKTADRVIAGDASRPITGIATTFMSNFETLRRAHDAGLSLIISHEPTYYHNLDRLAGIEDDPTYKLKRKYCEDNGLVIFRFHDHWHMRKPDPIARAFYAKLGLNNSTLDGIVELPPTRFADFVRRVQQALGTPNLRYYGDGDRVIRRVRFGGHLLRQIAGQDTDVFIWAEPKEFNTFDYFRDAQELGIERCVIGATHELIEEWGMLEPCAQWVKALVSEVPVRGLRTQELYWTV